MTDPWRWRCPEGHVAWEQAAGGYRCRTCSDTFGELTDAREGSA